MKIPIVTTSIAGITNDLLGFSQSSWLTRYLRPEALCFPGNVRLRPIYRGRWSSANDYTVVSVSHQMVLPRLAKKKKTTLEPFLELCRELVERGLCGLHGDRAFLNWFHLKRIQSTPALSQTFMLFN